MTGGELLIVGIPGPRLDGETMRALDELRPGGVILFTRNLEDPDQVVELTRGLKALLPDVVLWVDAEGGRVDRLAHVLGPAPAGERLAAAPPGVAHRAGRWIGYGLRVLGFDADFAPVADIDHGISGNALDGRCYGDRWSRVNFRARAFLEGLHASGIGGCLKHFPGLGAAPADTHHRPATIDLSRRRLIEERIPFRRLCHLAGAVMVGHALYPCLDPDRPASLSPRILQDLLRSDLEFEGMALADDLEMEGLAPWAATPAERAVAALDAGCDALLICHRLDEAMRAAEALAAPELASRRRAAARRWSDHRRHLEALRDDSAARWFPVATVRKRLEEVAAVC